MAKLTSKDKAGKEVEFVVKTPTARDYKEAKLYSNSVVASMLRQRDAEDKPAFIVRAQLPELRREAGIWTDKHTERLSEIVKETDKLERKLITGGMSKDKGKELAFQLHGLRAEWMELIRRANALDDETVEAAATNSEFDYLLTVCFLTEEGKKVFDTVEKYKEDFGSEPYHVKAAEELQRILYGVDSVEEAIKERPENKFLMQFGFMNDKMQLINKEGKLVDRDGKLIDEDGYYVNSNNERVDKDGKKLDASITWYDGYPFVFYKVLKWRDSFLAPS